MSLKTWRNGEKAEIIQAIIESNFKILGKHLSSNVLSLSTTERNLLSNDYTSEGLVVYDKTEKDWYEYRGGTWSPLPKNSITYEATFDIGAWDVNNQITILYNTHLVKKPCVQLYVLRSDGRYEAVIAKVAVDDLYNITLSSDIAFTGKVVIK